MSFLNGNRKKGEQSQVGSSIVQVGLAATMASMLSACGGGGSEGSTTDTSKTDQPVSLTVGGSSASFLLEGTDADLNAPLKQLLLASGASDQGIDAKVSSLKSDLFGDNVKNYKIEPNGDNTHFASTDTSGLSSMRTLVQKKDQDGNLTQIELVAHGPSDGDLTTQTLSDVAASVPKLQSFIFVEGKNGIEFFIKGGSSDGESKSVNVNKSTGNGAYTTTAIEVEGKSGNEALFTIGVQDERTSSQEFLKQTGLKFDNMKDELVFSIMDEDIIGGIPTYIAMLKRDTNINVKDIEDIMDQEAKDAYIQKKLDIDLVSQVISYEIYNSNTFKGMTLDKVISNLDTLFSTDGYVYIKPHKITYDNNSNKFDVTYKLAHGVIKETEADLNFTDSSSYMKSFEDKFEALLSGGAFVDSTGNSLLAEIKIGEKSEIVRFQMDNLSGKILNGVDKLDANDNYEYVEYKLKNTGVIDKVAKNESDFFKGKVELIYDDSPVGKKADVSNETTNLSHATDFLYVSFDDKGTINGILDETQAVATNNQGDLITIDDGALPVYYDVNGNFDYQWYKANDGGVVGNDTPFSGQTNYFIHSNDLSNGDSVYIMVTSDDNDVYYSDIFTFS